MGKFSKYKVELASLAEGNYTLEFDCDTEFFKNMEKPEILNSDVKVTLNLKHKGDIYDCTFTCKGLLSIPCDRCLDPMEHEVDTQYHLQVRYGDDYEDESDELLVIPYSDTNLNVAYMLADTILLTIPLRHVHALGKCNRAMAAVLNRHSSSDEEDTNDLDSIDMNEIAEEDTE